MHGGWDKLGTLHHEPGSISSGASVAAGLLHIFQALEQKKHKLVDFFPPDRWRSLDFTKYIAPPFFPFRWWAGLGFWPAPSPPRPPSPPLSPSSWWPIPHIPCHQIFHPTWAVRPISCLPNPKGRIPPAIFFVRYIFPVVPWLFPLPQPKML